MFNYLDAIKMPDMTQSAFEGYKIGEVMRANEAAKEAKIREQEQQEQTQLMIQDFISKPNKTPQDYSDMMLKVPSLADNFKKSYDVMDQGRKEAMQRKTLNVFAALQNGDIDTANKLLDDQITAAQNSGDERSLNGANLLKKTLEINPEAAKSTSGLFLSYALGGEKMAEVMGQFGKEGRAKEMQPFETALMRKDIALKAEEAGVKRATVNKILAETKDIGVKTQKTLLDLEIARNNPNGIQQKDIVKAESELRKEATSVLQKNRDVRKSRDQMLSILGNVGENGAELGAADAAAVVTFFKTIDPNSTVTATEGGIIQGAEGLQGQLAAIWNKAVNQGSFTDEARKALINTSQRIYAPVQKEAQSIQSKYTDIANRSGLNPENIFITDYDEPEKQQDNESFTFDPNSSYSERTQRLLFERNQKKKPVNNQSSAASSKYYERLAMAESGNNPNAKAKTSSASGLFQFIDSTWRNMVDKYGDSTGITLADKNDPQAQKKMVELFTQDNADFLKKKGINPSDGDLYIAHFLGAPKAEKMIKMKNSNKIAASVFNKEAKANRPIFFERNGKARTMSKVYDVLTSKVEA